MVYAPLLTDQASHLGKINIQFVIKQLDKPFSDLENFLRGTQLFTLKKGFLMKGLKSTIETGRLTSSDIQSFVSGFISYSGSVITGLLAVIFITSFLLFDEGLFKKTVISFIPNNYFEMSSSAIFKVERLLTNYLLGLFVEMLSNFTLLSIGLTIIGYPYAIAISLFAAVANIVPYLGPLFGTMIGLLLAVIVAPSTSTANEYFWILISTGSVFAITHLADNVIFQPLIFSRSLDAHPLEIFIAIFAGAALAGIIGMIVAVPTYTVLKVIWQQIVQGYSQYYLLGRKSYTN
jgi:predicted PurR-regulated permease PerM